MVGRGSEQLLIELCRRGVAEGVVKCEVNNLRLLVALVHFLSVNLGLVATAEAVGQLARGHVTFWSFRAGLGGKNFNVMKLFKEL